MSMNGPLRQLRSYNDGRTKQCYKNECDIVKIMARAEKAGTISHLEKYQGVYADYSDVNFFELTQQLTAGKQVFADLPAEIRREFNQDPDAFFAYVNDPANIDQLRETLPGLAAPGTQLPPTSSPDADTEAAEAAAAAPVASTSATPAVTPTATPPGTPAG